MLLLVEPRTFKGAKVMQRCELILLTACLESWNNHFKDLGLLIQIQPRAQCVKI